MNKREAKREACFTASEWLKSTLDAGAERFCGIDRYSPGGVKIEAAMRELIAELHNRGCARGEPGETP